MNLLFSFKGRIGRAKFWLTNLGVTVISAILGGLIGAMGGQAPAIAGQPPQLAPAAIVGLLVIMIPVLWASLAIGAKRCHDRGRSGWFQLIVLIPIIGGIWLLVELGFLRGIDGPNEYGPPAVPGAATA